MATGKFAPFRIRHLLRKLKTGSKEKVRSCFSLQIEKMSISGHLLVEEQEARIPLGFQEYLALRETAYFYVDKTNFIKQVLSNPPKGQVIAIQRRFGKSLNLDMLKEYVSMTPKEKMTPEFEEKRNSYFEGLSISKELAIKKEFYHQYPVVYLNFAQFSGAHSYKTELWKFFRKVYRALTPTEKTKDLINLNLEDLGKGEVPISIIHDLVSIAQIEHNKRAFLLIDEVDKPVIEAAKGGEYDSARKEMSDILGSVVKSTGILMYAIYVGTSADFLFAGSSTANALVKFDFYSPEYAGSFGFTQEEVTEIVQSFFEKKDQQAILNEIREWYDGYITSGKRIYNQWSVWCFVKAKKSNLSITPKPYWGDTERFSTFHIAMKQGCKKQEDFEKYSQIIADLLFGVEKEFELQASYKSTEIFDRESNFLTELVNKGELMRYRKEGKQYAKIPNKELRICLNSLNYALTGMKQDKNYGAVVYQLVGLKSTAFSEMVSNALESQSGYTADCKTWAEKQYHQHLYALLAGIKASFEGDICLDDETGSRGARQDIVLKLNMSPPTSIHFELKLAKSETALETRAKDALDQCMSVKTASPQPHEAFKGNRIDVGVAYYLTKCFCLMYKWPDPPSMEPPKSS